VIEEHMLASAGLRAGRKALNTEDIGSHRGRAWNSLGIFAG
jgi:hypothetical protein